MSSISYFSKAWHSGSRHDAAHHGIELDPQPSKPEWRPGWTVRFLDTAGKKLKGKIWQAQRDKDDPEGPTTYTVLLDEDQVPYHVTEDRLVKKVDA